MADVDNKKPDAAKLPPEDSAAHTLRTFAQSLAYSAIEGPARGAAQLVDHTFGTKLDAAVQSKFNNAGVRKPEDVNYGSYAWDAEQLGNGIGMVVPMWLARKAMVGKAEQTLVKTASVEGSDSATSLLRTEG